MSLRLHSQKNPAHLVRLLFSLQLLKHVPYKTLELFLPLGFEGPLVCLIILLVILRTCFGGVNDITPLKLQQEALLLREKHLLVYIVHLVALDQVDDVEVDLKLFLASVEENSLLLGEGVAPRAPATEAAAEVGAQGDNPIRHGQGEILAIHD